MTEDAVFASAAVAAPHSLAAEAGRDVLVQGGNAIEAMVAMAATIAVVYPHMNSIGGDGFWLIREPKGKVRAIEACGFAGEGATIEAYEKLGDSIPNRGPKAALTVPGAVGGWAIALQLAEALGGRLPLKVLLEAAARHARDGAPVSASEARYKPKNVADLLAAPGFKATYYVDGEPPKAGAPRKQSRLGDTLAHLGEAGLEDFYRGDIGREIAADLARIGSPVTRADLAAYSARWREPLSLRLKNVTLYNTPAPTQGLASLILLGLYERLGVSSPEGFAHAHALIEAAKRAIAARDRVVTDFDLSEDFGAMLSPAFLDSEAAKIDRKRAAPWPLPPEKGDTIWMGAIDGSGLAVSFIQSLYWEYGSGCVLPATGVTMQNRGIAFSLDRRSIRALKPGRRPFHTLNPPLAAFDDGRVVSYGSMGGDGQPQFQAQVFSRILAGAGAHEAVSAPRHLWGRLWGDASVSVKVEASYDEGVAEMLARAGHDVERRQPEERDMFGHAGALIRSPKGEIRAAHDPRADGGAEGI